MTKQKALYDTLIKQGRTEEEALKTQNVFTDLLKIFKDIPLLHEEALRCLSCDRLVLAGKCCESPKYRDKKDHFKDHVVEKTKTAGVFSVKMGETTFFIVEEEPEVFGLSLYHTEKQAEKNIKI